MKYSPKWTANLERNDEIKNNFTQLLESNNKVLDRLCEICYNMYIETEKTDIKFDDPNWAYRQANLIGQRKVLKDIMTLCTPTKERDKSS